MTSMAFATFTMSITTVHLMLLWFVFSSTPRAGCRSQNYELCVAIYLLASCPFDVQVKIIRRQQIPLDIPQNESFSVYDSRIIIGHFLIRRTLEWSLNRFYFAFLWHRWAEKRERTRANGRINCGSVWTIANEATLDTNSCGQTASLCFSHSIYLTRST